VVGLGGLLGAGVRALGVTAEGAAVGGGLGCASRGGGGALGRFCLVPARVRLTRFRLLRARARATLFCLVRARARVIQG
jgi:hypothetical protein